MPKPFLLYDIGKAGVDVDTSPLELVPQALTSSQNTVRDVGRLGIRNRPGLETLNATAAAGKVLGGIGVPFLNESVSGVHILLLGRGPTP